MRKWTLIFLQIYFLLRIDAKICKNSKIVGKNYSKNNFFAKTISILEFSAQNYPCTVGFVTICKSSIFDLFHQLLLLYENFVCSFSGTEKRSEVKFCTPVGLIQGYNRALLNSAW